MDSVLAFMIAGPVTKIVNPGTLKIVFNTHHFLYYLLFVMSFVLVSGITVDMTS